ncbi:hypothetical protein [Dokdonia sp. Hel_I_53]|uniref:hypothetical protein n=1 Tax=Dokdonia sp. Hel_I_53 TaxID=1566287 RepID=UPI0021BDC09C|nr:hypothetical protein [Dokdonia sp. Hel_I_53]
MSDVIALIVASVLGTVYFFLKMGPILYGCGYVLFVYIDAELVSFGLLSRTA